MNAPTNFPRVQTAWRQASEALMFRFECPYIVKNDSGEEIRCIGFLPDFGSSRGIVIGFLSEPDLDVDLSLASKAQVLRLHYSSINLKVYDKYDEEVFKEALVDWGFFGDEAMRPTWMKNGQQTP